MKKVITFLLIVSIYHNHLISTLHKFATKNIFFSNFKFLFVQKKKKEKCPKFCWIIFLFHFEYSFCPFFLNIRYSCLECKMTKIFNNYMSICQIWIEFLFWSITITICRIGDTSHRPPFCQSIKLRRLKKFQFLFDKNHFIWNTNSAFFLNVKKVTSYMSAVDFFFFRLVNIIFFMSEKWQNTSLC